MPLVFQGPLGYPGERGFRGEPVSHLHPAALKITAWVDECMGVRWGGVGRGEHTSTHVIAGYICVNYTIQQHYKPVTTQSQREWALSVRVNCCTVFVNVLKTNSLFSLCYNLFTGSTRSKGRARREGLAGKKVVGGSSQFTWCHRAWTKKKKIWYSFFEHLMFSLCLSNPYFSFTSFSLYKSNLNVRYFYLCHRVFPLQCSESIQWPELSLTMTYISGYGFCLVPTFLPSDSHSVCYTLLLYDFSC